MISAGAILIILVTAGSTVIDEIVLRDRGGSRNGRIVAADDAGIRIQRNEEMLELVPWDRIRSVSFSQPGTLAGAVDQQMDRATRIWRARSRLQRGDVRLAEPLFESLFEPSPDRRSETDLIIAEGLLRCRLQRGAQAEAILPALEVARLSRLGIQTDRYDGLGPVLDRADSTDLSPYLLGGWAPSGNTARLAGQLAQWDSGGDEVLDQLAGTYQQLIKHPSGVHALPPSTLAETTHAGVSLLRLGLAARHELVEIRKQARSELRRQLRGRPNWRDPWIHFYLGTSLLLESGDGLRRQGLVSLAEVPARHATVQPYLTGVALAMMARELDRSGDTSAAERLRVELRRAFPDHPFLRFDQEGFMLIQEEAAP